MFRYFTGVTSQETRKLNTKRFDHYAVVFISGDDYRCENSWLNSDRNGNGRWRGYMDTNRKYVYVVWDGIKAGNEMGVQGEEDWG